MRIVFFAGAAVSVLSLTACGPVAGGGPASQEPKNDPAPSATAEPAGTADTGTTGAAARSEATEPAAPKKMTKAEIEEAMAPPSGLLDLRPIVGTDPDSPLPAVFA